MTPDELRAWREGRGYSRPQLAALLGVDRVTVWTWETGHSTPPPYLALALRALELDDEER